MKKIHLICVGKLKNSTFLKEESEYLKRIKQFEVHIHEIKSQNDNSINEGKEVLKKIQSLKSEFNIALTETGREYSSNEFSTWFENKLSLQNQITFIFGGAAGHSPEILKIAHEKISLSQLTFPHQLARLLLVEQLYRAETIFLSHPYSK